MSNNNSNNAEIKRRTHILKEQIEGVISDKYMIEKRRLKSLDIDLNKLVYDIVTLYLIYESGEYICLEESSYLKKYLTHLDGAAIKLIVRDVLEIVSETYGTNKNYNVKSFKEELKGCKVSGGGKTRNRLRKRGTRRR